MRNFQDTFEISKWSLISAFSICMTVWQSVLKAETLFLRDLPKYILHFRPPASVAESVTFSRSVRKLCLEQLLLFFLIIYRLNCTKKDGWQLFLLSPWILGMSDINFIAYIIAYRSWKLFIAMVLQKSM